MSEYTWDGLRDALPQLFFPFLDEKQTITSPGWGDRLRLRDSVTGRTAVLMVDDESVVVSLALPDEPDAGERTATILRGQRTTSFAHRSDPVTGRLVAFEEPLWSPSRWDEPEGRVWQTGWRLGADYANEVAEGVVTVLRDGWGARIEDLQFSTSTLRKGPTDYLPGLCAHNPVTPQRPSQRGSAERCTDWDDFVGRLDWALATMPANCAVVLHAPTQQYGSYEVEFAHTGNAVHTMCCIRDATGVDIDIFDPPMAELGWKPDWSYPHTNEDPLWRGSSAPISSVADSQHHAADTVGALRDILGVTAPDELEFEGYVISLNQPKAMSYLETELGVPRR